MCISESCYKSIFNTIVKAFVYNTVLIFIKWHDFLRIFFVNQSKKREYSNYKIKERFAIWNVDNINEAEKKGLVFFYCTGLGEVKEAEPIINELKEYCVILLVYSFSGHIYAEKKKIADFIFFAPFDFTFLADKVFEKYKPKALFIAETDLWPGMIWAAKKHGSKILILNGGFLFKRFPFFYAAKFFWRKVLNLINFICAKYPEDKDKFALLGYDKTKIAVCGNLKYDIKPDGSKLLKSALKIIDSDIVITAGSTRGEEKIYIDLFDKFKKRFNNLKLIIAPRFLHEVRKIEDYLKKKRISHTIYSDISQKTYDCLVIDTFGDLQTFYSISDLVIIGGSLIKCGGQNPIEPALNEKPVIFGKYMQNFSQEADVLVKSGGGHKVENETEMYACLERMIVDEKFRKECGKKAYEAVQNQKGALGKTVSIIKQHLN